MMDLTRNDGFFTHSDADYNDNDKEARERHQKKIDAECELFDGVHHHIVIRHKYKGYARYALIGVIPGVGVKDKDISREAAMILISSLNLRRAHVVNDPDDDENSMSIYDDQENPSRGMLTGVDWNLSGVNCKYNLTPGDKRKLSLERAITYRNRRM